MGTTLNAHFWTLFTLLLIAGTVLTVVATLAAEWAVDHLPGSRRPWRRQLHRARPAPRIRPRPLHHAHH